jgi:hypothetical protein
MAHLDGHFEITSWKDDTYDEAEGAPPLGRATLEKNYTGELSATSRTEMLAIQGERGQAYLAQERVVGMLAGRKGSFVLQHGAAGATDEGASFEPRQWAFVVPGSGSGELAGLRGEGTVEHGVLHLDYELA